MGLVYLHATEARTTIVPAVVVAVVVAALGLVGKVDAQFAAHNLVIIQVSHRRRSRILTGGSQRGDRERGRSGRLEEEMLGGCRAHTGVGIVGETEALGTTCFGIVHETEALDLAHAGEDVGYLLFG